MPASPQETLNDLKKGVYAPVYFLQGEEPFYIDLISDYIEKNALDESQKSFNQVVAYGKDLEMNALLGHAKRFPMMSERQVVIIKEAQEMRDWRTDAKTAMLEQYVKSPLPSTILVINYKNKQLDGRKSITKTLKKQAVFVESKKIYDNQVPEWIAGYVKARGHEINQKSVMMIQEYVGSSLGKIANEIDKLLINFKEKTSITEAHVQKYIGISKDYNVFELQKALVTRDVLKANKIIQYFEMNPKDNPIIPIVTILFSFFSRLFIIHENSGTGDQQLARQLGVNPYFLKDYKAAARVYPKSKLFVILNYFGEADRRSKGIEGGGMAEGAILKELVFKIMH